jgi:integrase
MDTKTPTKQYRAGRRGGGSIFKNAKSRYYWCGYTSGGVRRFESTKCEKKEDAIQYLNERLGKISGGAIVTPQVNKLSIRSALELVTNDMKVNGRQIDNTQRRIDKHLLLTLATSDTPESGFFHPDRKMHTITTSDLTAYVAHRIAQKAAPASCNLELAIMRRAFRLAIRSGTLISMPFVPMMKLNNVRKGFFERHEFDAVLRHLPAYLHGPLTFAFLTGWRLQSEVLSLTVGQVDVRAGVVRLEPGVAKNREARTFYLTTELTKLLKAQLASIEALKARGILVPYVFHRPDGSLIKDCRKTWKTATAAAGYPHKLFHDFRRSAVRSMERSGVPRTVAMQLIGHKTESVYRRYAIVDATMLKEAAGKLDAFHAGEKQKAAAERRGQLRRFKQRKSA